MKDISEAEVLQALQDAMGVDEPTDAMTPDEAEEMLCDAGHHIDIKGVRKLFKKLIKAGVVEVVKVNRPEWDGRPHTYSAIQFLENGKKK